MKKIKIETNGKKTCSYIDRLKITILPKAIYRFNAIPIKVPMAFFTHTHKNRTKIFKFVWKHKRPWVVKAILRKKNRAGGINFRLHTLQSYSNQDSRVLAQKQKYRSMTQDRKSEINPCTYGHLIFDKAGKNIHCRKDRCFIH